jgi:hypothetical protein
MGYLYNRWKEEEKKEGGKHNIMSNYTVSNTKADKIDMLLNRIQEQKNRIENLYHDGSLSREGTFKLLTFCEKQLKRRLTNC